MAKKKKPNIAKAVLTRRAKQAALQQGPSSEEKTNTETVQSEPTLHATSTASENQPEGSAAQSSITVPDKPKLVTHKKFGKFRILHDENFVKTLELGLDSDSETNSSIEVKVVDPSVSSESDGGTPTNSSVKESPSITPSPGLLNYDSKDITGTHISSINEKECISISSDDSNSDAPIMLPQNSVCDIPLPQYYQPIPLPEECIYKPEIVPKDSSKAELNTKQEEAIETDSNGHENTIENNVVTEKMGEELEEQELNEDDDDEVITIVQIIEDNDEYYDIQMTSPSEQNEQYDTEDKIQNHFKNLQLEEQAANSPLDSNEDSIDRQLSKMECENQPNHSNDSSITPYSTVSEDDATSKSNDDSKVRRSSRIKTISSQKQRSKPGFGKALNKKVVKLKPDESPSDVHENNSNSTSNSSPNSPTFPVPLDLPVKVKSRWRRCSELEMNSSPVVSPLASPNTNKSGNAPPEKPEVSSKLANQIIEERLNQFVHLQENFYLCEKSVSKETKRMICDCFLTKEEIERGEMGCGEDCLNRLLMIECNYRCPVGDRCANRKFQKRENAPLRVFYADKKGCGLEAAATIPFGTFLMEYVGEVLNSEQFYQRAQKYSLDNNLHHYFMALKGEEVIDATLQGNISRFINHSCEPNAETQKWTVNGELRIGFFSKREIKPGEEITFDYQFKRFGKEAQRCYCGANNCRGWIGGEPDSDDEEYEEEEEVIDEDVSTTKIKKDKDEMVGDEKATKTLVRKPKDKKLCKPRKYRSKADFSLDADIEDDLEALNRTGIKNQHHTLTLSRTMVRAKTSPSQLILLKLLREADLPCRRLFLDYRGLRLLAPWCGRTGVNEQFRLEMLQTLERLPIPNKSMVAESKLFNVIEKWRALDSHGGTPLTLIDEATGLPLSISGKEMDESSTEIQSMRSKIVDLCKQLHERWSSLKEIYKIPKKERIQQMKEHEREANIERRAADSSGTRERNERERDRERDKERERDRERYRDRRDRERDRDREKRRRGSPESRRSSRHDDTAVMAPMSKEERRRAFAEAAAAAERSRSTPQNPFQQWAPPPANEFPPNMFPPGMMPNPGMMGGPNMPMSLPPGMMPPGMMPPPPQQQMMSGGPGMMPIGMEWMGPPDCSGFFPPPFCMTQPNFMNAGFPPGFMFPPQGFPGPQPPSAEQTQPPGPPPVKYSDGKKLPSLWRSAQDEKGRIYFYHVKLRIPQWIPPAFPEGEGFSSSEEEEDVDDLENEVSLTEMEVDIIKGRLPKFVEGVDGVYKVINKGANGLIASSPLRYKKNRPALVTEMPISPRTEEDKIASKLEMKRYKETKEKLKKRKERALAARLHAAKKAKLKGKSSTSSKLQQAVEDVLITSSEDEAEEQTVLETSVEAQIDEEERARRVKETFRASMAKMMVYFLNPYRKSDAPCAKITNNEDFKHLARKLTHFVMLKELKHCRSVDELQCNDSVKQKAKEFVRKYMSKFGPIYQRPSDEHD